MDVEVLVAVDKDLSGHVDILVDEDVAVYVAVDVPYMYGLLTALFN